MTKNLLTTILSATLLFSTQQNLQASAYQASAYEGEDIAAAFPL